MIPFRQEFKGRMFTRHNIFPLSELEADRQAKAFGKEGFAVEIVKHAGEFYIYLQNDKGWLK